MYMNYVLVKPILKASCTNGLRNPAKEVGGLLCPGLLLPPKAAKEGSRLSPECPSDPRALPDFSEEVREFVTLQETGDGRVIPCVPVDMVEYGPLLLVDVVLSCTHHAVGNFSQCLFHGFLSLSTDGGTVSPQDCNRVLTLVTLQNDKVFTVDIPGGPFLQYTQFTFLYTPAGSGSLNLLVFRHDLRIGDQGNRHALSGFKRR
mmetsp:Transcript_4369/g.8816  ORF Transcript_4369/g.8816 Transcript_4369/m.8816 type:complete len:203 (+) Transcript_4369:273-881(+)